MTLRKPKPAEHYHNLAHTLRDLEADLRWGLKDSARIPAAWAEIALLPDQPVKQQVTIRLDSDVLRFFRAMGQGYLTRINQVLRAFMEARLAGVIAGAEAAEYKPSLEELYVSLVQEVTDLGLRRNARARIGKDTEEMDVVIDKALLQLKLMEQELGIPEEERVTK